MQYFDLTSGTAPALGLGTWQLRGDTCTEAVRTALDLGYEQLDTAEAYRNHEAICAALKGYDREKVFITTKILPSELTATTCWRWAIAPFPNWALTTSICCCLAQRRDPAFETLPAMAQLVREGKVRSIGVSNSMIHHLEEAALPLTEVPITVNQVKYSSPAEGAVGLLQGARHRRHLVFLLRQWVADRRRRVEGASRRHMTAVCPRCWRWPTTVDHVIPKSANRAYRGDIFDWDLEDDDFAAIERLGES